MHEFRMGHAAELLGVSVDTVRRWADSGQLEMTRTDGGQRVVAGPELARFAAASAADPTASSGARLSARNRFTGLVTRVIKDEVVAQVEIQAGPHRVVSLITREAADEMQLEPGVLAVAAVKSTNVVVELPST
jgi:molybdopterin-binding protein